MNICRYLRRIIWRRRRASNHNWAPNTKQLQTGKFDDVQMKRNKLKRNKTKQNKDGHHRHARTAVIVLSDGGCSDGETSQEKLSAADSEERKSSLCTGFKMAPIFLQHVKIKGRSDGGSYQTEHKSMSPSQRDDVQGQHPGSHLTGKPVICRERLPASHLESCLKAIQKSNPAFPVSTVFNTLLKKASQRLHESGPAGEVSKSFLPESALVFIFIFFIWEHSLHPDSMQKEKRRSGPEGSQRLPKRLRSDPSAEGRCPLSGQDEKMRPKGHKLSPVGLENSCHTNPGWMNLTTPATELIKSSEEVPGGKPCFILIGFHNRSVKRKYTFCQFLDFTNQDMMKLFCSLLCNRLHTHLLNEGSFFAIMYEFIDSLPMLFNRPKVCYFGWVTAMPFLCLGYLGSPCHLQNITDILTLQTW